ncbi:glycosyltransferase [Streptomyces sp. NPDC096079]|uniref:glycosyltransferase n=1 Tax=Streptomyces sp. NPDC096079 TaxID=3155820 RepID=UPI00332EC549
MKVLIATAGSRGDVAPYTGLGASLRDAGHEVVLAATPSFAAMAASAGLDFRPLPADPGAHGDARGNRHLLRAASAFLAQLGEGFAAAVDEDTDLLLLSTTTAPLGWHVAEARGIPSMGVYLQPTTPTADFAPPVGAARSLGRLGNRAAGQLTLRMTDRVYAPAVTRLRARLGLPALTPGQMRRRQNEARWPVFHGFSTALVPRPSDWESHLTVTGSWWPHTDPALPLPAELEAFLAAGPAPVLVGFGSMATGHGPRLSALAVQALRQAGLRGVLQSGAASLAAAGDDILTIGDVPHSALFPRLAAVVHHAGAGTSAAALRAALPSVTVPVTADQPFWAARLAMMGAAPSPLPFSTLTGDNLAAALSAATRDPSYTRAATAAQRHMATEKSAAAVVAAVKRLADQGETRQRPTPRD